MTWVATAIIGSAVIGAIGSSRVASQIRKGERKAIETQNALVGPFSDFGKSNLPALQSFLDEGASSKFSDTQAFKDIVNTQKARGQSLSGNTLTELARFNAVNFRPQRFNELFSVAALGQNAAVGQATNIGIAQQNIGSINAAGTQGIGNSILSGIQGLVFLNQTRNRSNSLVEQTSIGGIHTDSDRALKTNIEKVGEYQGMNIYTWDWNDIGKSRGNSGSGVGVMADEVDQAYVRRHNGYLQVDYGSLF